MWAGAPHPPTRRPGPTVLTLLRPLPLGELLEPHMYAALQTLDDPNEICTYEAVPGRWDPQAEHVGEVVGTPGAMVALQPWWQSTCGV